MTSSPAIVHLLSRSQSSSLNTWPPPPPPKTKPLSHVRHTPQSPDSPSSWLSATLGRSRGCWACARSGGGRGSRVRRSSRPLPSHNGGRCFGNGRGSPAGGGAQVQYIGFRSASPPPPPLPLSCFSGRRLVNAARLWWPRALSQHSLSITSNSLKTIKIHLKNSNNIHHCLPLKRQTEINFLCFCLVFFSLVFYMHTYIYMNINILCECAWKFFFSLKCMPGVIPIFVLFLPLLFLHV